MRFASPLSGIISRLKHDSPRTDVEHAVEESILDAFTGMSLEAMERAMIRRTLHRTQGNRTRTAEILGISLRTLRCAIAAGDARHLERAAYRIGSALGKLSAAAALDIALRLERQGRHRELSQSLQTLHLPETELQKLKALINQL